MAHDLAVPSCQAVRYAMPCYEPTILTHLQKDLYVLTGDRQSADVVQITPAEGVRRVANLWTEGHEVWAACLIDGS